MAFVRCDFAALERRDFERVCLKYPAEKTRLHEYAMARMASDALYHVLNEENPLFADMTKVSARRWMNCHIHTR